MIFPSICSAVPSKAIESNFVKATVVKAQWRGKISFETKVQDLNDGSRIVKVQTNPSWVFLLKNVEGITNQDISTISESFSMREPSVGFVRLLDRNKNMLYVWLSGSSEINISPGDTIQIHDFRFEGDERGGAAICKKFEIVKGKRGQE